MKSFMADFKGATKIPAKIEQKINDILKKGGLKAVNVCESHGGRLYVTLYIDENAEPRTECKVFRHHIPEAHQDQINEFLAEKIKVKSCHQTISQMSNNLMTLILFDRTERAEKTDPTSSQNTTPTTPAAN